MGTGREKASVGTILPMRVNVERRINWEMTLVPKPDNVWLQDNGKQSFHGILRLDRMRDPNPTALRRKRKRRRKNK